MNKVTLIIGRKGSGKSFLANILSKQINRIVILDTQNEYIGGFIVQDQDSFYPIAENLFQRENFRLIAKFGNSVDDYEDVIEWLWESDFRDYTILFEEINIFASPQSISKTVHNMISLGRHKNLNVIAVAQRPFMIHPIFRSQTDQLIVFNTIEPRDLKELEKYGVPTREVQALKQYEPYIKEY